MFQKVLDFLGGVSPDLWTFLSIAIYSLLVSIYSVRNGKSNLLNSIPPWCTGVGVGFTFFILWNNLSSFQFTQSDTSEIEALIRELSAAFSTSIIGIASSLVSVIFVRPAIERMERKQIAGKPHLETHPHQLLYDIRIAIESLKGQDDEQATLYSVESHVKGFTEEALNNMNRLFQGFSREVKGAVTEITDVGTKGAQIQVKAINTEFSKTLEKILDDLSRQFKEHQGKIQEVYQQLADANDKLAENMDSVKTTLANQVGALDQSFGKLNESVITMNDQLQEALKGSLDTHLNHLQEAFEQLEEHRTRAQGVLDEATVKLGEVTSHYQQLVDRQETLYGHLDGQKTHYDQIGSLTKNLLERMDQQEQLIETMTNRITDIGNALTELQHIDKVLRVNGTLDKD